MGGRERPPDPPGDDSPWATEDEGSEPDWAEQIRSGRRDRGAKLRETYSTFADEPTPFDDEPANAADGEPATAADDEPAPSGERERSSGDESDPR